ncbi:Uncharacterized protein GY17_00003230 [Cryptosporidium hominis]|uniref:Uncharacterized protein n=1 Tax=Cryptosporidium hominis TaxID=237895 RepID=A0ABX5BAI5_CRYHO|nr:Uncharacterized protein GY17_00003230 [Cryptosporidium hominis]|eukprot:PPS93148.1 Uncharacterized protein GY17_00003230 [Cryptosporidium hominis]
MKTFNFAKLVFIFAIVALFGNFRNTEHEVSTVSFEQSFVRLKLRKPLSKSEKKELQKQIKILEEKMGQAEVSGNREKVNFFKNKIDQAKAKINDK